MLMSYFYHTVRIFKLELLYSEKISLTTIQLPWGVVHVRQDEYLILSPVFSPGKAHHPFSTACTVTITQHFCSREVHSVKPTPHPTRVRMLFWTLTFRIYITKCDVLPCEEIYWLCIARCYIFWCSETKL